jgi:putative transposon-encoded protein
MSGRGSGTVTKFLVQGDEMLKKTVSKGGNSAAVYVPKKWTGRTVVVILLNKKDGGTPDGEEEVRR